MEISEQERSQYQAGAVEHYAEKFPRALGSEILHMARMAAHLEFDEKRGIQWVGGPSPYNVRMSQQRTPSSSAQKSQCSSLEARLEGLKDEVMVLKGKVEQLEKDAVVKGQPQPHWL
ncbi:hypothetical protein QTJ16_001042 [Diplocarpon rosae]|uniref:Transposase n=1 Tax=Diplocarpon rosae TaxID=946125 RepID=A0AAD9T6Z9_9HELO|nr:hypothetical protein QTJ16_001042 [Diplocarpon rosae]